MRSGRVQSQRRVVGLMTALVVCYGCSNTPAKGDWRRAFLEAAGQVAYGAKAAPVVDSALPPGTYPTGAPHMTIAAAQMPKLPTTGFVLARIESEGDYLGLGIYKGVNYLWTDGDSTSWRQLMVPADTTKPVHWLDVAPHNHAPPPVLARLLVIPSEAATASADAASHGDGPGMDVQLTEPIAKLAACGTCPSKPTQWCTAKDTSKALAKGVIPIGAMTEYFKTGGIEMKPFDPR